MLCFIYKSLKTDYLYLYVTKKDDFSDVPEVLINSMGKMEFVMDLMLFPERKLFKEDAKKVIGQLKESGFFLQLPPPKI
jgi:uncharacterized protein YcgL (UPF0745 family)